MFCPTCQLRLALGVSITAARTALPTLMLTDAVPLAPWLSVTRSPT
jgi:hypothetical protein